MAEIYLSNSVNPHYNLAVEEYLTFNTQGDVLFLWQNDATVVIGNHQNAWSECDLNKLAADGGRLARRTTGGGAVYHDLGNLNFSFVCDEADFSVQKNLQIIADALGDLGIVATATGRNDLTVNGKKISGNAFLHRQGRALHHGTLLINSDLDVLGKYLTVNRKKLDSKGVKSVRARVTNLSSLVDVTVEDVKSAIINRYARAHACTRIQQPLPNNEAITARAAQMATYEYLMGENPRFSLTIDGRWAWGGVTLGLSVKGDVIEDVKVWTDALDVELPHKVDGVIKGATLSRDNLSKLALSADDECVRDIIGAVIGYFYEGDSAR